MAFHLDLPPISADELKADRREKFALTCLYSLIAIGTLAAAAAIVWWHP